MPRRRCTGCGEVGGAREVVLQVERAGLMEGYVGVWCIVCVVGLTTWLELHTLARQNALPMLADSSARRKAKARSAQWALKNGLELPSR